MTANDAALRDSEISDLRERFVATMRKLAATITLVTTRDGDGRYGMAATAVASLSADPPALLVCIKRTTSLHAPVSRVKRFCVNLLDQRHQALFREFIARNGESRFLVGDWTEGPDQLPCLTDAVAAVFCSVEQQMDYGTHTIFIGRVENVKLVPEQHPLLYQDGSVGEFRVLAPAVSEAKAGMHERTTTLTDPDGNQTTIRVPRSA